MRGQWEAHCTVREIPPVVLDYTPERPLDLDADLFGQCLSSAPSGTAPGPGGCTNEMLRVCLDDREVLQLLFRAAEDAARGEMSTISVQGVHVGDDDGSAEEGWWCSRCCNRNKFLKIDREDFGQTVWEESRVLFAVPIRVVNESWCGMCRTCCQVDD